MCEGKIASAATASDAGVAAERHQFVEIGEGGPRSFRTRTAKFRTALTFEQEQTLSDVRRDSPRPTLREIQSVNVGRAVESTAFPRSNDARLERHWRA